MTRDAASVSEVPKLRFTQLLIDHPGEREREQGAKSKVSIGVLNRRDKVELVALTEDDLLLILEQASKFLRILRRRDA